MINQNFTIRLAGALLLMAVPALAVQFQSIRIGDQDGFGFQPTTDLKAANGFSADTNNNGLIEQTEFLPDLNKNGTVATGSGDDFDNRSSESISVTGATDTGTTGTQWTDISLSTSFQNTPGGATLPNEPLFEFRFDVAKADIVEGSTLFFNLVFGDYDVSPASVRVTTNDGANGANGTITLPLSLQSNNGGEDGLVQAASTVLNFDDVFSDGGSVWNGYLDVKFVSPNEPYTAFDFVELSLDRIPDTPNVPDTGATLALLGMGVGVMGLARRKMAK